MRPFCTALDTLPRRASSYCPSSTWILAIGMRDLLRLHVVVLSDQRSCVVGDLRLPPWSVALEFGSHESAQQCTQSLCALRTKAAFECGLRLQPSGPCRLQAL